MPQQTTGNETAASCRLVVPDEWFVIALEQERRERAVAALVNRQFAGVDKAPHLKAQARQETLAKAEAAYAAGGLEMFTSLQKIAGIPIAAPLVTFMVPPPATGPVTAEELAATLAGEDRQVTVADLLAGRSVRMLRRARSADETSSATLEVFTPVPGSGSWLLLSFAAPIGPLAPLLTKLFDAICTTLRWD